jgi:hypothetical protein
LCNDLLGLSCEKGVCKCSNSSYWKDEKEKSQCGIIIFFINKNDTSSIIRFLIHLVQAHVFSQKCASSEECDGTKNLICKEGVCECKENILFWNEKSTSCGNLFKVSNDKTKKNMT